MTGRRGATVLAVLAVLAVLLLVGGCASGPGAPAGATTAEPGTGASRTGTVPSDPGEYAAEVRDATNALRADHAIPPLADDACAASAARTRARALVGADELAHAALDAVIATCAPPEGSAAENLSRAAAPPADVVDAWSRSPGHRANLLDPALTGLGVGCVADETAPEPQMLCSQVFLG
ncbi:CAP domain-containing protein [Cellulosimicrobium sp. CUA-896]|uniref:CAP domain-containing protein n=1 Tax=Cellulosimicrobium sp. CUA-896 TaxID=1517881 RepID=UPI001301616A|nr:CAP domain-containing protein [Cellulosimicrobium sp. CUA-896]